MQRLTFTTIVLWASRQSGSLAPPAGKVVSQCKCTLVRLIWMGADSGTDVGVLNPTHTRVSNCSKVGN